MKWNDMVRVDRLSVNDDPLGFAGRAYLDNEYQETCVSADAVTGCVWRFVVYQVCHPIYDPFGDVADVTMSSRVLEDADGNMVYEDVFGDVKIFVSKKLLTEYRGKIPDILPDRFYTVSDK